MQLQHTRRLRALLALVLVSALGLAACGDDDETPAASGDPQETEDDETTTTTEAEEEGETLEVTGIEYEFQGLGDEVAPGTELTFTNGGKEVHELVVMHIKDGETRPIEELLELPEEEVETVAEFVGVSVAAPGEDGEIMEGDLTVEDPGRYVALCFIPVGTTEMPEGPPQEEEGGGPPHFTQGMVQEFQVQ